MSENFERIMKQLGLWDGHDPTYNYPDGIDLGHIEYYINIAEKMADHCVALQHKNTIDQCKFNEAVRWLLDKDVVDDRELAENIVRTIADIFDNTLQRDDDKKD